MYYQVETDKSFDQAVEDLQAAVTNNQFGVLHIHDLGGTMRSKGVDFKEDCKVFEVCNPVKASQVLAIDMRLNMALPCRISVFTEKGQTKIGMIEPVKMLDMLNNDEALKSIAAEVETKTKTMIDEAK
ncbi:DUF302 domain-containing protein [Thiomicrorhabdus sediminis]|uniref:DUF302 domain-containing protein n=1 Tax=Thiomicrorhabdus sediminis TaxID=2580412 RepID=A0A4P9K6D3_9GAMM|nr:DUF302 domain-containing protein [Thiomicrorhabdus sediminis]QCU89807.1 DUF302 domain-containing protein [Thiomicrorhabdus sediminis]